MKKRIMAILLMVVMSFGMFTTVAMAADTPQSLFNPEFQGKDPSNPYNHYNNRVYSVQQLRPLDIDDSNDGPTPLDRDTFEKYKDFIVKDSPVTFVQQWIDAIRTFIVTVIKIWRDFFGFSDNSQIIDISKRVITPGIIVGLR